MLTIRLTIWTLIEASLNIILSVFETTTKFVDNIYTRVAGKLADIEDEIDSKRGSGAK